MKFAPLAFAFALAACATPAPDPFPAEGRTPTVQRQLELFASFLTGTFESIPQSAGAGDSTPVKLRIARLWPERAGEYWFYLEHARAGDEGRPFLQRLMRAGEAGGEMMMVEYALPLEPARMVGAWKDPKALADVAPGSLREIPGCRLQMGMQHFTLVNGGTIGKGCRAHVPQGAYEVSDFFLSSSSLRAWDRGYDKAGKQVWGSTAGPLEMRRMAPTPR